MAFFKKREEKKNQLIENFYLLISTSLQKDLKSYILSNDSEFAQITHTQREKLASVTGVDRLW
jgi:hypothetical protein